MKSGRKLAKLLGYYDPEARDIRLPDETVARGYLRDSFADPWSRYLPAPTATSATSATALASAVADVADVAVTHEDEAVSDEQAIANVLAAFPGTERLEDR